LNWAGDLTKLLKSVGKKVQQAMKDSGDLHKQLEEGTDSETVRKVWNQILRIVRPQASAFVKEFNSEARSKGEPCLAERCVTRKGKLLRKGYPLKMLIPELKAESDSFRCYIVAPIDEH